MVRQEDWPEALMASVTVAMALEQVGLTPEDCVRKTASHSGFRTVGLQKTVSVKGSLPAAA